MNQKQPNRTFIDKELAAKVIMDSRATAARKFRTRLDLQPQTDLKRDLGMLGFLSEHLLIHLLWGDCFFLVCCTKPVLKKFCYNIYCKAELFLQTTRLSVFGLKACFSKNKSSCKATNLRDKRGHKVYYLYH